MKRILLGAMLLFASVAASICAAIAYPQALFAHTLRGEMLDVYSDAPIDDIGGRTFVAETESILSTWPLKRDAERFRIFVANSGWRRKILFSYNIGMGGVVYYPLSGQNAFLSGADFRAGRLIAPSGAVMPAPRTLAYYGAHEVAHLLTGKALGTFNYLAMPHWIREGVADYIALRGAPDYSELFSAVAELQGGAPIEIINRFGVYPKYRLLVAHLLDQKGWGLETLIRSGMSLAEAESALKATAQ